MRLNSSVERGKNSASRLFSVAVIGCDTQDEDHELNSTGRNEVVVEIGASEHAVCDIKLLTEVEQVLSVQVKLPNGCSIV